MNATKLVFSNHGYIVMAAAIFAAMLLILSFLSQYVFFAPYFVFYVPYDRMLGFSLIVAVSVLAAIVVSMNVYRIKLLQRATRTGAGLLGSIVGASAGACSCGPVGFAIVSTFGSVGGVATAFLVSYETPLRLASIGILAYVYYTTSRSLGG